MDGHPQWRRVIAVTSAATYTYGKGYGSGHLLEYPKKGRRLADGSFDYCNSGLPNSALVMLSSPKPLKFCLFVNLLSDLLHVSMDVFSVLGINYASYSII